MYQSTIVWSVSKLVHNEAKKIITGFVSLRLIFQMVNGANKSVIPMVSCFYRHASNAHVNK